VCRAPLRRCRRGVANALKLFGHFLREELQNPIAEHRRRRAHVERRHAFLGQIAHGAGVRSPGG